MSVRWALLSLGLVLAGCGESAEPGRFTLHTPGAQTGAPLTPTPEATAAATPTPAPTPKAKPVTRAERRVVRGWSEALRRGRVEVAASYFSVPSRALDKLPLWEYLETQRDVEAFHRGLTCGAELVKLRRSTKADTFVVGIFRLTERPGAGQCGAESGKRAAYAFRIYRDRITSWAHDDEELAEPTPAPTPTASPDMDSA
jgi:hypothetical protein